jgi:hypothetical protein
MPTPNSEAGGIAQSGLNGHKPAYGGLAAATPKPGRLGIAERRARLVVQCACDILGLDPARLDGRDLHIQISVTDFEQALRQRYSASHPDLIFRTDSTLERARLSRARFPGLPRVILRRGAPPR